MAALEKDRTPSALIDTSVLRHAVVSQAATTEETVQWGPSEVKVNVAVIKGRRLPGRENDWLVEQIRALPTVGRLAREGKLKLYGYVGTTLEEWPAAPGMRGQLGDALRGVSIRRAEIAIDPSYLKSSIKFDRTEIMNAIPDLVRKLINFTDEHLIALQKFAIEKNFSDGFKQALRAVPRLRTLCWKSPPKHLKDIYHIWTAEINEIDYFLTTDCSIIRYFLQTSRAELRTKLVGPSELVRELGVEALDPMPICEGETKSWFDQD
jgi:hypothetical protein